MDSAWYLLLHILLAFQSKSHVNAPDRRRLNYILHPSFKGGWESEFSDFCLGETSTDKEEYQPDNTKLPRMLRENYCEGFNRGKIIRCCICSLFSFNKCIQNRSILAFHKYSNLFLLTD